MSKMGFPLCSSELLQALTTVSMAEKVNIYISLNVKQSCDTLIFECQIEISIHHVRMEPYGGQDRE